MGLRAACVLLLTGLGLLSTLAVPSRPSADTPAADGTTTATAPTPPDSAAPAGTPCDLTDLTQQSARAKSLWKIATEAAENHFPETQAAAAQAARAAADYVTDCFKQLRDAKEKKRIDDCKAEKRSACIRAATQKLKFNIKSATYGAFHLRRPLSSTTCDAKALLDKYVLKECKPPARPSDPLQARTCKISEISAEKLCGEEGDPSGQNDPRAANYQRNKLQINYCCDAACSLGQLPRWAYAGEEIEMQCDPSDYLPAQCNNPDEFEAACRKQ
jgi:hypothetical protein